MTPDQYHRILVALDVVLESFEAPLITLSSEEAKIQYELRVIRSKILKAESGHPFPFNSPELPPESVERGSGEVPRVEAAVTASTPPAAGNRRLRILVVDDQESVRTVVRLLIEAEPDMEVVGQASNGKQGVEMVAQSRPDVVLLDVNMPILDGFTAAKEILSLHRGVKIIMFSANRSDEYLEKARQLGITTYLTKPASRSQLISAVRAAYAEGLLDRRAELSRTQAVGELNVER
jgi:CheY-like chemotaxis protein